jgi:hypothetical protein
MPWSASNTLPLAAGAELASIAASEVVASRRGHGAAAGAAEGAAGEQVHRPAALPEPARLDGLHARLGVYLRLPRLHRLPERVLNDPEVLAEVRGGTFVSPETRRLCSVAWIVADFVLSIRVGLQ